MGHNYIGTELSFSASCARTRRAARILLDFDADAEDQERDHQDALGPGSPPVVRASRSVDDEAGSSTSSTPT